MEREVKRVPLDFTWPLHKVWQGFINPFNSLRESCPACDGSGQNPETKQISDDWYDFGGTGRRWCDQITQDEVDALAKGGRLHDFTSHFVPGKGWVANDPPTIPTAEQVNAWSRGRGFGHDAINRWICVETRAKRLGVYGKCPACKGSGEHWFSEEARRRGKRWKDVRPPTGEGWQLWETVSEGSPVSPVFTTAEDLARWMASPAPDSEFSRASSYEVALRFVQRGWAPSMLSSGGVLKTGVEAIGEGLG